MLLLEAFEKVALVMWVLGETATYTNAEDDASDHRAASGAILSVHQTFDRLVHSFNDFWTSWEVARDDRVKVDMCRCTKNLRSKAALLCTLRRVRIEVELVWVRAGVFQDLFYLVATLDEFLDAEAATIDVLFLPVG